MCFLCKKFKVGIIPTCIALTLMHGEDHVTMCLGNSLLKIAEPKSTIQVGIIQTVNFRLEKCVLQPGWFRGPVRRRTWRNVTNFIPKDVEFCTLRVPWVNSFWMNIILKYFVFWQPLPVLDKSVAMATHNAHMRTYYPQIYLLTPKPCLFQVSTF